MIQNPAVSTVSNTAATSITGFRRDGIQTLDHRTLRRSSLVVQRDRMLQRDLAVTEERPRGVSSQVFSGAINSGTAALPGQGRTFGPVCCRVPQRSLSARTPIAITASPPLSFDSC